MDNTPQPVLQMRGIVKVFPGVQALTAVDLTVMAGEIHGLVGKNGAGKSTLMAVLMGIQPVDTGTITIGATTFSSMNPREAIGAGVAYVPQRINMMNPLTVAENVLAGMMPTNKAGFVAWRQVYAEADRRLKQLGLDLDVRARVEGLSVAEQTMLAIAKALFSNAKLIVLDEPTAALPRPEQMLDARARRVTLSMYGRKDQVRVAEAVARVHEVPARPLKVVVTEALRGGRGRQAFFSTRPEQAATTVLREFTGRWSIEESNQGSKQQLGFEEPPGWSRLAVERTAPIAMLLYSLIVVWFAQVGVKSWRAPVYSWYRRKRLPSFADMLAVLKRESLREGLFARVPSRRLREKVCDAFVAAAQIAA